MVVGNKCDLYEQRQVSSTDGRGVSWNLFWEFNLTIFFSQFAAEHDAAFYEVSASSGVNVSECFTELARILKRKRDSAAADGPIADPNITLDDSNGYESKCCRVF